MRRLKVLISAYSCEPGKGSESGIGWNIVRQMAVYHDIWVITRTQNKRLIEPEISKNPVAGLNFVYHDFPGVPSFWDGENILAQLHYPIWQLSLLHAAKKLHSRINFDIAHHVTWGRYWTPSLVSLLGIPFIWGPIGGGESTPESFLHELKAKGRLLEFLRNTARILGEADPFVRATAMHCSTAFATTPETAARLNKLHVRKIILKGHAALSREQVLKLASMPNPPHGPVNFISMGRLLHWKGFHLALKAFALAGIEGSLYRIVGDGREKPGLEALARKLGIEKQVVFTGHVPRSEALDMLKSSHVLLHPSYHDSGGWVCIEAMAAKRPVVCLDLGGPATLTDANNGIKIPAGNPDQTVKEIADAIRKFADNPQLAALMGKLASESVLDHFLWEHIAAAMAEVYKEVSKPDVF
jgi:glycosyltransferase involved in cell wall biosynthesis